MNLSRSSGLLLLVVGALTFLGTTNQMLPAVAFFPGMLVCVLGLIVFMKANHVALEASEKQTPKRLNPEIRSTSADLSAERQAEVDGASLEALSAREGRLAAQGIAADQVQNDELVLYEVDQADAAAEAGTAGSAKQASDFVVTTDVSFPLELQQQSSLAEQIAKLRRLPADGIISKEEFGQKFRFLYSRDVAIPMPGKNRFLRRAKSGDCVEIVDPTGQASNIQLDQVDGKISTTAVSPEATGISRIQSLK